MVLPSDSCSELVRTRSFSSSVCDLRRASSSGLDSRGRTCWGRFTRYVPRRISDLVSSDLWIVSVQRVSERKPIMNNFLIN